MRAQTGFDPAALRFAFVGLANTLAGYGVILFARGPLGLPEVVANALGYAAGLALGFTLHRRWTFAHRGPLSPALLRFASIVLAGWAVNALALLALIRAGWPPALAHAAGIAPYTVVVFLGCRAWVFTEVRP